MLAGLEHGRTIPLAAFGGRRFSSGLNGAVVPRAVLALAGGPIVGWLDNIFFGCFWGQLWQIELASLEALLLPKVTIRRFAIDKIRRLSV
jgi:hypothetical protein